MASIENIKLDKCKEFCEKIISICDSISNGSSTNNACKDINMDIKSFRKLLEMSNKDCDYKVSKVKDFSSDCLKTPNERFLSDLFEDKDWVYVPDDFEEAIKITFSSLVDREREVLTKYYFEDMSFFDIAKEYRVTTARIQQIVHQGMRMLRHPTRLKYFINGVEYSKRVSEVNLTEQEKAFIRDRKQALNEISVLKDKLTHYNDALYNDISTVVSDSNLVVKLKAKGYQTVKDLIDNLRKDIHDKTFSMEERKELLNCLDYIYHNLDGGSQEEFNFDNIPIEYLDLSLRTFNAVRRAGFDTLGDLANLDYCDLLRIRNLGKKSLDELLLALDKYGVVIIKS